MFKEVNQLVVDKEQIFNEKCENTSLCGKIGENRTIGC